MIDLVQKFLTFKRPSFRNVDERFNLLTINKTLKMIVDELEEIVLFTVRFDDKSNLHSLFLNIEPNLNPNTINRNHIMTK